MPKMSSKFAQYMLNICPRYTEDMQKIYLCTQDMTMINLRYAQVTPKICSIYALVEPRNIGPWYAKYMPKLGNLKNFDNLIGLDLLSGTGVDLYSELMASEKKRHQATPKFGTCMYDPYI